jgi:predicted MFS family arabinose efflux permease
MTIKDKKTPFGMQIFATMVARLTINTAIRMLYPFLPAFSRGLGVPIETLIRLLSLRSALAMMAPVFGRLSDRYGRRNIMVAAMVVLSASLAAMALWPGYWIFVAFLLLGIVAQILYQPAHQAYISERVPYEQRGRVIAITELAWAGAMLVGVPLVGWMLVRAPSLEIGLPRPFIFLSILGIVSVGMLSKTLSNQRNGIDKSVNAFSHWKIVLTNHSVIAGLMLGVFTAGANEILNVVFASWLEVTFGMTLTAIGLATVIIGVADLLGEGGVIAFSDRYGKRRTVGWGIGLSIFSYLALPLLGTSRIGALLGLFFVYLTFEFAVVAILPLMTELMPEARSSVMSANIAGHSLGRMIGALTGGFLLPFGIGVNGIVAAVFNVLALIVLLLWVKENKS